MSSIEDGPSSHTVEQSDSSQETEKPHYDVGDFSSTATYVKTVIYVASAFAIACWVGFIVILANGGIFLKPSRYPPGIITTGDTIHATFFIQRTVAEFTLLAASLSVTLCSDGLGYVHATSLRWALYREHRLEYNTNFRLFTSAKSSLPNRWFMNALTAASLILCYASVSMLLVESGLLDGYEGGTEHNIPEEVSINAVALGFLGVGLFGQVATAILCLRHHKDLIPSWSPNPLWNTLITQRKGAVEHQPGRCMLSVFERNLPPQSRRPWSSKRLLWHLRSIRWIVLLVWALCILSFLWPTLIICTHNLQSLFAQDRPTHFIFKWESSYGYVRGLVEFALDHNVQSENLSWERRIPTAVQYILCLLIFCFFQGAQSLGLHCVELLVNMSRDEQTWRKANLPCGSKPAAASPLLAALSSWRTLFLTILKALLHWLIGQGLTPGYTYSVYEDSEERQADVYLTMSASRLFVFAIATAILALFTTSMAFWPIRGPQPAAWGHLPTLADLVDDWGKPLDTLWWGDKGVKENGTRHAGTATRKDHVREIVLNGWYN